MSIPITQNTFKKYINHTFTEAAKENEEFVEALSHLVCITNYTTIECPGDFVAGTKRCLAYFLDHYVCSIDHERVENTDEEVDQFNNLSDDAFLDIHRYIVKHPKFNEAKAWYDQFN